MKAKLTEFWKKYEARIVLILGFVLVAVIAFEGGYLKAKSVQNSPLIIEKTSQCSEIDPENTNGSQSVDNTIPNKTAPESQNLGSDLKNCQFVGSKNSNKYHLPTCQYAKRIKPENIVCFSGVEDAIKKGYQPDKGCIK